MSFLAPLYFLGALAIAGPIIFHLIRRQPKGEIEFSSLMFLESTPPRLTRRNRLENWPLLLLRCAAICMLAFAFARPFLPLAQSENVRGVRQAVILLVDQSASMQRGNLWEDVARKGESILEQTNDETLISVIAFDDQPRQMLSLQESTSLLPDARKGAARDALKALKPSWRSTDIGKAIRYAADQAALLELADSKDAASDVSQTTIDKISAAIETRIVLISDLQSGAHIQTLQGYQWPDQVWLDIETLSSKTQGNVSARVMPSSAETAYQDDDQLRSNAIRVQVNQSEDGSTSTFYLHVDDNAQDKSVVQIPPGQTRIVSLELPTRSAPIGDQTSQDLSPKDQPGFETASVTISGDQDSFDNTFYFVRPRTIDQEVLIVENPRITNSSDQADTTTIESPPRETLSFYVTQIPWSDRSRNITVNVIDSKGLPQTLDPSSTPFLIYTPDETLSDSQRTDRDKLLRNYLTSGGRIAIVLDRRVSDFEAASYKQLLESPELEFREIDTDDYSLISAVDFKSPLIAPLADPGVNDFSNIRIWNHRHLAGLGEEIGVIFKLDDGSPLLLEKSFPADDAANRPGKLWVLTSGWQPLESQFALSTKFVPVMLGMLGPNHQVAPASLIVGEEIEGIDSGRTSVPGFVQLDSGESVAVNLDASESDTKVFDRDRIAEFGAVISTPQTRAQDKTAERALRDVELEARQGWWQWLILATLALIAAETFLAAKNSQRLTETAVSK